MLLAPTERVWRMRTERIISFTCAFSAVTATVLLAAPLSGQGAANGAPKPSTVLVVQERVLLGRAKATTVVESSTRRIPATTPCGPSRLCTPAWDLRVVGLTADDSTVAPNGMLAARFTVENRGKVSSDASEVRLCIASGPRCLSEATEVPLPILQPGERVAVTHPVPSYSGHDVAAPYSLLVRIDPDMATGEVNRANNDAMIGKIVIDTASLVIETFDVTPALRSDAKQVPVTLIVRNASKVASSRPASLQVGGVCGTNAPWSDMGTRLSVPALGPDQAWSATVSVRHPSALIVAYRDDMPCRLWTGVLPSTKPEAQLERSAALLRPYVIQNR